MAAKRPCPLPEQPAKRRAVASHQHQPSGTDVAAAIDQAARALTEGSAPQRIRQVAALAEALGKGLAVESLCHFLRELKGGILLRASEAGVKVAALERAAGAEPADAKEPTEVKADVAAVCESAEAGLVECASSSEAEPSPKKASGSSAALRGLLARLQSAPLVVGGEIVEARFAELEDVMLLGVASEVESWVEVWGALAVPVDRQSAALPRFLNMALSLSQDRDHAALLMATLLKAQHVTLRALADALAELGGRLEELVRGANPDAWHVFAKLFVQVFPEEDWGWRNPGWSWLSWWRFVERCLRAIRPRWAFNVLLMALQLLQQRMGCALHKRWREGQVAKVLRRLEALGRCSPRAVLERLEQGGVAVPRPHERPARRLRTVVPVRRHRDVRKH